MAVRRQEEIECDVLSLHKSRHWYRTHELAWHIFKAFDPSIKLENARQHFVHANSAKCCLNKKGNAKADNKLFKNCGGYLGGELAILAPEIIVTQGNEARDAIKALHGKVLKRVDEFASVVELNGAPVFWLHTYHPNNWGKFNKQRAGNAAKVATGWVRYAELMYQARTVK